MVSAPFIPQMYTDDLYVPGTKDRAIRRTWSWPHKGYSIIKVTDKNPKLYNDKIKIVILAIHDRHI